MSDSGQQLRDIKLRDGSAVTLDDADFWRFFREKLFIHNGYACIRDENGSIRRLHREILGIRDSRVVRFLDGDVRNCTRANLQAVDRKVLATTRPAQGECEYKGVSPYRGKWQATIRIDGKLKWLGSYQCPMEAAKAYDEAAIKHRGRSGVLNFPNRGRRRARNDAGISESSRSQASNRDY